MKRILILIIAIIGLTPTLWADNKNKKEAAAKTEEAGKEINWLTFDEVQVKMNKQPRKVFIDVYTGWCGWCKVMDKKTFSNPDVIKYINDNFYAVKFNAERQDSIRFAGKMYGYMPDYKSHVLAVELLRGNMSYPTSVIMQEGFTNPQIVPGYLDVPTIERVLKYIHENKQAKTWEEYSKDFKPSWVQAQG